MYNIFVFFSQCVKVIKLFPDLFDPVYSLITLLTYEGFKNLLFYLRGYFIEENPIVNKSGCSYGIPFIAGEYLVIT